MSGSIVTHGKCILAGEHSVVRGGEALVFPLRSRLLKLEWAPAAKLEVTEGPFAIPFEKAWSKALELTGFRPSSGARVQITSNIPVQAGLGSSAALSVAVVRFLEAQGAQVDNAFALALDLENIFHGKSSGIDIASVLAQRPIGYRKNARPDSLALAWQPLLFLADTGARSSTKACVEKVEAAHRPDLDDRMSQAVGMAKEALAALSGESALAESMKLAASCFAEWGLASPQVEKNLYEAGALAVKPTGSGGGGFLLSLWKKAPPAGLGLIPVWADSARDF